MDDEEKETMSWMTNEWLSIHLDDYLDDFGYSEQRIKERIHKWNKSSTARCLSTQRILKRNDIDKIFVGSLREGTGFELHSDIDILQVYNFVQCHKDVRLDSDSERIVFHLDDTAPNGHFLLNLKSKGSTQNFEQLSYALDETNGQAYLSSQKFMSQNDDMFTSHEGWIGKHTCYMERKGPSIPKFVRDPLKEYYLSQLKLETDSMDYVRAFPCHCPSILDRWSERKRNYEWPRKEEIQKVLASPGFVVPVGQKGTENEHLQWRACFTLGEICLIQSLNNMQTKIHALLKLITKYQLQPICGEITSYVIKNVVLWQAENRAEAEFQPETLIDRLTDALTFLKSCIATRQLSNYMIPERNLLVGKVTDEEKEHLITKIDELTENLPQYITLLLFLDESENKLPDTAQQILETLWMVNVIDRINSCKLSVFTVDQLTEYCFWMFYARSYYRMILYNIVFVMLPCICKFGPKFLHDPLQIKHEKIIGTETITDSNDLVWDFKQKKPICRDQNNNSTVPKETKQARKDQEEKVLIVPNHEDPTKIEIPASEDESSSGYSSTEHSNDNEFKNSKARRKNGKYVASLKQSKCNKASENCQNKNDKKPDRKNDKKIQQKRQKGKETTSRRSTKLTQRQTKKDIQQYGNSMTEQAKAYSESVKNNFLCAIFCLGILTTYVYMCVWLSPFLESFDNKVQYLIAASVIISILVGLKSLHDGLIGFVHYNVAVNVRDSISNIGAKRLAKHVLSQRQIVTPS